VGCGRSTRFTIEAGPSRADGRPGEPNWRESLACECGLINRIRASIQVFQDFSAPGESDRIYATEQVTPLFDWLSQRFPNAIGSEYIDPELAPGSYAIKRLRRLRHEDVTRLSFEDGSLDHLLSFDVIEHVPDHAAALSEFARCLRPGGTLLLSAPFDLDSADTLLRARQREDGSIEHLLEPQYHGDPVAPTEGVLCYQTFGWSLLDALRGIGFEQVRLVMVWSPEQGYLGWGNVLIHARRRQPTYRQRASS
jgi:SAM-dependent methyltransferase